MLRSHLRPPPNAFVPSKRGFYSSSPSETATTIPAAAYPAVTAISEITNASLSSPTSTFINLKRCRREGRPSMIAFVEKEELQEYLERVEKDFNAFYENPTSQSVLNKPTSVFFVDATEESFEPKVLVAFEHKRGRVDRKVEIERRRRLYESYNIVDLLLLAGLNSDDLIKVDCEHLPLEIYDDTSYDCRDPADWMRIVRSAPQPKSQFLPARAFRYDEGKQCTVMAPCRVVDWNETNNKLTIFWGPQAVSNEKPEYIPRIFVNFFAEEPINFVQRLVNADKQRSEATSWIKYRLCCDSMPTTGLSPVEPVIADRLRQLGTGIPLLSKDKFPDVNKRTEMLIEELNLEWRRTHNRILFQYELQSDDSLQKLVQNTTKLSLDQIRKGPCGECDLNVQSGLVQSNKIAEVSFYGFNYDERMDSFIFNSYYTQNEVFKSLTAVRNECITVVEKSLFNLPKERQIPLSQFRSMQIEAMDSMAVYMQNTWRDNLVKSVGDCFANVGKGWLNIHENNYEIYSQSKLKRFFTTVMFMMEDTLYELVYNSLKDFTVFFEEVCDFDVRVIDSNTVKNTWPGSEAADAIEKQPLFTIDLVVNEGKFSYSTEPKEFEEAIIALFDRAIQVTQSIPQIEKYLMRQYFWEKETDGLFLDTVKKYEEVVCSYRERVRSAVVRSLNPLGVYVKAYDEQLDIVRLDENAYIEAYAAVEHTNDEMRDEIKLHLKNKKTIQQKISPYISVGNFVVDCQSFCHTLADKNQQLAKLVMNLINKIAEKKTSFIRESFSKICKVIEKMPTNAEKLHDLKIFIFNLPEKVYELSTVIADMRTYYNILEGFQYGLSDDSFKHKWEAIGWSRQLDTRLDAALKELEKTEEELRSRMSKEMEEFQKRVDALQRIVATFSKYTNASDAVQIAADVKVHNIEIKKCAEAARNFNNDQRLFGEPLTDYRNVFDLEKEFKPYSDLWLTTYTWQDCMKKWHTDPFEAIDAEELDHTVLQAQKTMFQLGKTFKEKITILKIVDMIKASVESFKPIVPIVLALRNPGMKERHWKGLTEKLGKPMISGETIQTIADCRNYIPEKEVIVAFCEVAAKEYGIEKSLIDMKAKWDTENFHIEPYKGTKTYILKDHNEVIELLEEHLNITQQLQFSHFRAFFAQQIDEWEKSLQLISDILEQWIECQKSWRYLQPIFDSEDIALQLPKLHKIFSKVDGRWRKMMAQAHQMPNALQFCTQGVKALDILKDCNHLLEEVQRGLNDYLQDKRQTFARFYFLSDEELLSILSQSKDVRKIDNDIKKLFEFMYRMLWKSENSTTIVGFISAEGEEVNFPEEFTPEGNVELWLKVIENLMKQSVHAQVKQTVEAYVQEERAKWVLQWPGQCVIAASQIFWTKGVEDELEQENSVKKFSHQLEKQLMDIVDVVQSPLNAVQRINTGALITIEVHANDTVDQMVAEGISDVTSFNWIRQLRFYFEEDDLCHLKQVDAHFIYGGEYLGNTGRLVVTPLTDRIYLTLTGALSLCLGGAPAGPAGTGKTETTKDLAKALAKQCVVFNCQEGMTYLSMGKFFKGLAWSGAWACFDEFNRIDVEVLSVVAQQVTDLQQACVTKQYRIIFEDSDVTVDPTYAIFITMNPGYAGRTELPDNLKVLFRPVACMVPDYAMIAEIRLFSYGYKGARALAQKMVMTFKLSSEQLSSQDHYDFGMRAVNTVISAAGINKRENPDQDEDILLLRALRDSNIPKFLKDDIVLFEGIIGDLFPGVELPPPDIEAIKSMLGKMCSELNLQPVPMYITKCLQLYDVTTLRHGLMLVGPTGAGKTMAHKTLKKALSALGKKQLAGEDLGQRIYKKVYTHICNPKSVTMDQLYGAYDENGEWKDGVLCILFRDAATYGEEGDQIGLHWVIFDGPVDALWIESMNTVLDDNKKLCLVSNEIIQMSKDMTMMFEVEDLAVASPATVSRCGMIYMEPETCAPTAARIESWMSTIPAYYKAQKEMMKQVALDYLDPLILHVRRFLKEYAPTVNNNLVHSFFNMMDSYIPLFLPPNVPDQPPGTIIPERQQIMTDTVTSLLLFSIIWSVGASCDDRSRDEFNKKFRKIMQIHGHEEIIPSELSVYEYCFTFSANPEDEKPMAWIPWLETCPPFSLKTRVRYSDLFIPTVDIIRQNYVVKHLLLYKHNVAAVGPTGVGKSISITELISTDFPEEFLTITFTFSAQTSANVLQDSLMSKLDKRRMNVFGAPAGKQIIAFIDDTNLPQKEVYGAQPPIELLRQIIGQGGIYNLTGHIKFNSIIDMAFVLAMGPPGGGRNPITNRFMRYFNFVSFPELSDQSKRSILNTVLCDGFRLAKVEVDILDFLPELVQGTLSIFTEVCKIFVPTPNHVHYSFNLRDIMRVFDAIYNAIDVTDKEKLLRLWLHENTRVFGDRLINARDRQLFRGLLDAELKTRFHYENGYESAVTAERLIFGDCCNDKRIYEEITDMDDLSKKINEYLDIYNHENQPQMDLVMFLDAIEHVTRISRVLRMPRGHCLLLGMGGSGRKSMTRLAISMCDGMDLFAVEVTKNYSIKDWHEALGGLLLGCGCEDKKETFTFSDTQIVNPTFLEDVAALLTSGDVPNLFDDKSLTTIYEKYKSVCLTEGLPTSKIGMYSRFTKEVNSNLHVILTVSPIGDIFRERMRMFPSLINCCTIDWFAEWPKEALISVAARQLEGSQLVKFDSEKQIENIAHIFEYLHVTATEVTEKFFVETKRRSYCTPTSYLNVISVFLKLLQRKREFVISQRTRLSNGLDKLRETEDVIGDLEEKLKAQQPVLKKTQQEIEVLMDQLKVDRAEAAEKEASARVEEMEAAKKAQAAAKLRRQCAERLAAAEPALLEAVKVVKEVKPAALSELANYTTVGDVVRKNLEALAMMLNLGVAGKEFLTGPPGGKKTLDWFLVARTKLKNVSELLRTLTSNEPGVGFNKEAMDDALIEKITPYYQSEDCTPSRAKTASQAVEALCKWFRAMYDWFFINKEVIPLREQLSVAENELKVVNDCLAETRGKLKEIIDNVKALQQQYEEALLKQKKLEDEIDQTTQKLNRAARLIDGLAGEKQRWVDSVVSYDSQKRSIVGDMLFAAGATSYFGPLTRPYRKELLDLWHVEITKCEVCSTHYEPAATIGDPLEIQGWQVCGLPSDALSTENAIIMRNSNSWPLLIDPQGQANNWIRQMHKQNHLQVCKPSEPKFMKVIEGAIRLGLPCLLENVGESLNPALEPILLKQTYLIGSSPHIRVGDSVIMYDDKFSLYMTTKLPNPLYSPETITTVTLLNFFITRSGLEDQLLGKTVEKERKDLEDQKVELTESNTAKNRELKALQDNILMLLQEVEGDILDKEELIDTLEMSKTKSIEINDDLAKAKETEMVIDETREKYRIHAFRGSLLFFCVSSLSLVDPMYQFSLQWFINLFSNCIDLAERPEAPQPGENSHKEPEEAVDLVEKRIDIIMDYTTYNFYVNVCRSLFEKHKLLFSFYLCNCMIQEEGKVDADEMRFFLTGATNPAKMKNPAPEWVSEQSWNDIAFITTHLPNFLGFDKHVVENLSSYRELFDVSDAHRHPLPGDWGEKCTPLQRLIITRCFRLDKVTRAIQDYVCHFIGERYIIVPHFNLMDAYKDSDCCTPLIFIISAGSDPMNDLLKFAESMRMGKKLDMVSLGQGQGKKAEDMVSNGLEKGQWVLLQNCHLATSWMSTLECIVENFNPETIKKEFRLWLTSMPSDSFPVSVLQIAVKMTNEPPLGLRANVTRSYYGLKEEDLTHLTKPNEFKCMLFAQCMFHAVIQERRRFGSLGFNIPYEFNDSDRLVCILQLRKFLDMYSKVPFDVLTFLTGEINYGGRVTDDWDRRCVMTMIKDFICAKTLNDGYKFSPLETYHQIEPGNKTFYLDYLDTWPINADPAIFGLHENADITSDRNEASMILSIILSLQAVGSAASGVVNRDAILQGAANGILGKLPDTFNIVEFQAKYPTSYEESMNTVLVQEAIRYNALLSFIKLSLNAFLRAIKGEVVMSSELETLRDRLFVNGVPEAWSKLAYPSLMPLSSWIEDLLRRVAFIKNWYDNGALAAFWVGGLFFPQAFLTGTLQNYARKVHEAIDSIKYGFKILAPQDGRAITQAPKKGAIIYGLFMEGARWNDAEHSIVESRPKELFTDMPPILLDPIVNKPPSAGVYVCPVYKTLTRAGTLSTTGHSTNFVLPVEIPIKQDAEHWIKRGVACLVSLNF